MTASMSHDLPSLSLSSAKVIKSFVMFYVKAHGIILFFPTQKNSRIYF